MDTTCTLVRGRILQIQGYYISTKTIPLRGQSSRESISFDPEESGNDFHPVVSHVHALPMTSGLPSECRRRFSQNPILPYSSFIQFTYRFYIESSIIPRSIVQTPNPNLRFQSTLQPYSKENKLAIVVVVVVNLHSRISSV